MKGCIINPKNFRPIHQSVGCIIENDGKIVLLMKGWGKSGIRRWSIPGGKLKQGENPEEALIREIREETGIELSNFEKVKVFNVRLLLPDNRRDFVYHLFKANIGKDIKVKLSDEHEDYKWVTPEQALKMDLQPGIEECIVLS